MRIQCTVGSIIPPKKAISTPFHTPTLQIPENPAPLDLVPVHPRPGPAGRPGVRPVVLLLGPLGGEDASVLRRPCPVSTPNVETMSRVRAEVGGREQSGGGKGLVLRQGRHGARTMHWIEVTSRRRVFELT